MAKINPDWLKAAFPRPASTTPHTPLDCPQNGVTKLELFVACALISLAGKRGLSFTQTRSNITLAQNAIELAVTTLESIDDLNT